MKSYIDGYYCRDDLHLQIMNKDSNRRILEALRRAYPEGLSVEDLAKKTKLPVKTIYAQKAELYREYYINHMEEGEGEYKARRGRPSTGSQVAEEARKRVRIVIEDANGLFDPFEGKKPVPLPPGNVVYSDGFAQVWHKIVVSEDEELLCEELLRFLQKMFNRISSEQDAYDKDEKIKKKWVPEKSIEFCCSQCGLNHEARDFIRATLLHLIDKLERKDKFIDLLRDNKFLTQEAFERVKIKKQEDIEDYR